MNASEAQLRATAASASQALVARAVNASASGMTIADATRLDYPLTYVNEAFTVMTGYGADECLGRNCRFLQGPDTDPTAVTELGDALREGRETRVVLLNLRKDGTPFWNELRMSPVQDAGGRVTHVIGVQHDVSDQVAARRHLERDHHTALVELDNFREALAPAVVRSRPHLDLAAAVIPAEQGVAGDFHLVLDGPDGATILVLGDAMGHGLEAAGRATFVRASLATSARFTHDPQRLLVMANDALVEKAGTSAEFVTVVCVVHHPQRDLVRWASAGHAVPLALDSGTAIGSSEHVGTALGIASEYRGTCGEVRMAPGEGILLASDGLSDARSTTARSSSAHRLGDARVGQVLREVAGASASDVVAALLAAARRHANGRFFDDLCLVAARAR